MVRPDSLTWRCVFPGPLPSSRGQTGLLKKLFVGVAVGLPMAAGLRYAIAEKQERRKMRLLVEGVRRFVRCVCVFKGVLCCFSKKRPFTERVQGV